jgi:hypothetical protein
MQRRHGIAENYAHTQPHEAANDATNDHDYMLFV